MLAEIARHRRGAALGGADEEEVRCGPAAVACRDGHGCSSGAHAKRGNRRAAAIDSSLRTGCPKATTARSQPSEIGRANVCTPVTNAPNAFRLLLEHKTT